MINIIGSIHDSSGYSNHTRQLANALDKLTEVKLSCMIPAGFEKSLTDRELEMIKRNGGDINIIITHPLYWKFNTTAKRNWVYLVWEGDKVPDCFIDECLNPDIEYILVPSEHTRNALVSTLHNNFGRYRKGDNFVLNDMIIPKIILVPHGVNLDLFYPKEKKDRTIFLCNKGFRNMEDRGGVQYAIKAFIEEFNIKDNVEMIVKINPAYPIINIATALKEIGKDRKDLPIISITQQNINYNDLVKIYNQATVFLSPTRADAFNIPCIEAMACGLPVITTNFGGQAEYVNNDNGWLIDGELKEVEHELAYEGIKWMTPNIEMLRKTMREIYNNPELIKQKSKQALIDAKNYTWEKSAKKIISLI